MCIHLFLTPPIFMKYLCLTSNSQWRYRNTIWKNQTKDQLVKRILSTIYLITLLIFFLLFLADQLTTGPVVIILQQLHLFSEYESEVLLNALNKMGQLGWTLFIFFFCYSNLILENFRNEYSYM